MTVHLTHCNLCTIPTDPLLAIRLQFTNKINHVKTVIVFIEPSAKFALEHHICHVHSLSPNILLYTESGDILNEVVEVDSSSMGLLDAVQLHVVSGWVDEIVIKGAGEDCISFFNQETTTLTYVHDV